MADNTPSFRPRVRTPRSLVNRSQSSMAGSLRLLMKIIITAKQSAPRANDRACYKQNKPIIHREIKSIIV